MFGNSDGEEEDQQEYYLDRQNDQQTLNYNQQYEYADVDLQEGDQIDSKQESSPGKVDVNPLSGL